MTVTSIPVHPRLPPSRTPRSEGVHVSGIIRAIATQTGILKPEWAEEVSLVDVREITDPVAVLRISIGLAWEEWYIPQILGELGVQDHPEEMCVDGIYMSKDGESIDVIFTERLINNGKWVVGKTHEIVVHEVKATYKSMRTVADLSEQWMWITQCKAYCKGTGTRFCKIHVLFLCGDYTYPIKPQLHCWLIEFTQAEIDDCWQLLTDFRDHRFEIEKGNL